MLSLVNVISRLMWSHFEIPFTIASSIKTTGYCYNSVNVITFGLAQSDHIKQPLQYSENFFLEVFQSCCWWSFIAALKHPSKMEMKYLLEEENVPCPPDISLGKVKMFSSWSWGQNIVFSGKRRKVWIRQVRYWLNKRINKKYRNQGT